jgi:hypothetical protein
MKPLFALVVVVSLFLFSCKSKIPDVSGIKINLATERFEKKLFDTTAPSLSVYLQHLQSSSPSFTDYYLKEILNADLNSPADSTASYVNQFVKAYRNVYTTAENIFSDFGKHANEIKYGLQFVKYYFPAYKVPGKIITYIGPADGYGDILLSGETFIIGLQHHLGKDYPLYKTDMVRQFYPDYISRRFQPEYISINCMKNVVNDLFPENQTDATLVTQMVEKGKRLFLLQKFLPKIEEYQLIGFTNDQLKDCYKHEAVIWDLFIKNSLLQSIDKDLAKKYLDEGPKTQELGEGAPGNIGSFSGWQIVKKYMDKNPKTTLPQLMALDDELLFEGAKYKP